ncbi:MAG TPA: Fic family protein [Conexibacter sp.]|jgi:death-on-curing protein|nr:Fic family protein [Conexibacter sp.]
MERLSIEDVLLIAEAVLGAPAEGLVRATRLGAVASALAAPDRHRSLADKAAVLCSRLVRNHPLPDGNKRVALLAMLELVARNQGIWTPPTGGQDEIAATIERLAARELSEAAFAAWVRARVTIRQPPA